MRLRRRYSSRSYEPGEAPALERYGPCHAANKSLTPSDKDLPG